MFPINPDTIISDDMYNKTLHSTMFPINPGCNWLSGDFKKLYMLLCFLLINAVSAIQPKWICLYIPLCFLLIRMRSNMLRIRIQPLHSTMFPINREQEDHTVDGQ